MGKHCGTVKSCRRFSFVLATGAAVLVIGLAAWVCYPPPWHTMQDGAGSAFPDSVPEIDLNSADAEQLCLLPGIGPEKAAAIILYRETYGGFAALDEVLEVRGIGEATVASWQGMAVVR